MPLNVLLMSAFNTFYFLVKFQMPLKTLFCQLRSGNLGTFYNLHFAFLT